jgi:hypothetical protein
MIAEQFMRERDRQTDRDREREKRRRRRREQTRDKKNDCQGDFKFVEQQIYRARLL